jgi:dihydropteroate synthase-like protein
MKPTEHLHFVTGRLAEAAVRQVVSDMAAQKGFQWSLQVLPITVAALMTARWLLRHLDVPSQATQVILPGYLLPELETIQQAVSVPVVCGPKNILDLPHSFGLQSRSAQQYGSYDIEIIAEINHANRLAIEDLIRIASDLTADGADIIDLGCTPGCPWADVGLAVRELKALGIRVSIDSFDPDEVASACRNGAELVLSVNSQNCHLAADWAAEVVAIPDTPQDFDSLRKTVDRLEQSGARFRLDPILEPIGLGFADSLMRYARCRQLFPEAPMMMGIGNLTELTDVDSAGVNAILLGFCQELQIHSVLTTQVINWARSSVRECDLARRLVYYARHQGVPPKNVERNLVLLRDPKVREFTEQSIRQIAEGIKDHNFRLFASGGKIHAVCRGLHAVGNDPFEVMQQVMDSPIGPTIDASHAFYLGFEMCKALQAITLGKNYEQDEPLSWGFLTRPERHWRLNSWRKGPSKDRGP